MRSLPPVLELGAVVTEQVLIFVYILKVTSGKLVKYPLQQTSCGNDERH